MECWRIGGAWRALCCARSSMKKVASWLHLPPTSSPKTTNLQRSSRAKSVMSPGSWSSISTGIEYVELHHQQRSGNPWAGAWAPVTWVVAWGCTWVTSNHQHTDQLYQIYGMSNPPCIFFLSLNNLVFLLFCPLNHLSCLPFPFDLPFFAFVLPFTFLFDWPSERKFLLSLSPLCPWPQMLLCASTRSPSMGAAVEDSNTNELQ